MRDEDSLDGSDSELGSMSDYWGLFSDSDIFGLDDSDF